MIAWLVNRLIGSSLEGLADYIAEIARTETP